MAETFVPNNLVAGDTQLVSDSVTIVLGNDIKRGAVLGKIAVSGKFTLSKVGTGDGSEKPYAVAAEDVDASTADVTGVPVFIKGEFNARALTIGTGHTADTVKDGLRAVGIYVKDTVAR